MTELEKLEKELRLKEGNLEGARHKVLSLENDIRRLKAQITELTKLPEKPKRVRKAVEYPVRLAANVSLVEPEPFSRSVGGSDYGTDGRVIARKGNALLVWFKGHTSWAGLGITSYKGGALYGFYKKDDTNSYRSYEAADRHGAKNRICFAGTYEESTLKEDLATNDELVRKFLGIDFPILQYYKAGTTLLIDE